MLPFRLAVVLLVAEFSNVQQIVEGVPQFKRCYNTSEEEMHCFDVQYDTSTNQPLFTSIQNAIRRCQAINSTLVIIKNEEIDNVVQQFTEDHNHIIGYFWLNAYQINEFSNSDRWHWVNSTLPNLPESAVSSTNDPGWYTAVLEFRSDIGGSQFYLTAKQPSSSFCYVCEYSVSNCVSTSSNDVRLMYGRCYTAVKESVTWYEARSMCIRNNGDLASFPNITSIDFTSWLGSDPNVRFWIGLRFIWYTWGNQGQEVKYMNWNAYGPVWNASCVVSCYNCYPTFSWASRNCTDYMFVVCHTITPLSATTTPVHQIPTSTTMTSTAMTSTAVTSTAVTMPTTYIQQVNSSTPRAADVTPLSATTHPVFKIPTSTAMTSTAVTMPTTDIQQGSLGIGLGVGLGVGLPLVIFIILTVIILAVRNKRLKTLLEQKTRSDRIELEQANDPAKDRYEQLKRNRDNSTESIVYDRISGSSEAQYEEVITN